MGEGEDRLQLLHQWLTCDDEAGRRLWFDTGLFVEFRDRAKAYGWRYVSELRRRGRYIDLTAKEMESCATRHMLTIHDRLKPPDSQKQGKKPGDFPTLEQFHGYLSESLVGIRDEIEKEIGLRPRTVPLDEPLPGTGEETDQAKRIEDTIADGAMSQEEIISVRQRRQVAAELLRQFRLTLAAKLSLQAHFDILCEAHRGGRDDLQLEEVAEEIILFLQICGEHFPEIREYCKKQGINDTTYHSYNRRLRREWRSFQDGPGRNPWQQYIALLKEGT
jgi:hypothetical protein